MDNQMQNTVHVSEAPEEELRRIPQFRMLNPHAGVGTCLQGAIEMNFFELTALLGEPTRVGSGDGKTQVEWIGEIDGKTFTIYDWKEDKRPMDVTDWHIGAKEKSTANKVIEMLRFHLDRAYKELEA